jgi:GAF domain-containing protein
VIWRVDGELLRVAAHHGALRFEDLPIGRDNPPGCAALERKVIHVLDVQSEKRRFPVGSKAARRHGIRTTLSVPLLEKGQAIGVITLRRSEVQRFTAKQIELLKTFADQAVIAIENVRLFNETKEALERQTATAEILKVIASSPTDVQPVFDVIVESAVRLCGARFGRVYRYSESTIHMVAGHGLGTQGLGQVQRVFPRPAAEDTIAGLVILTRRPFFVKDIDREEAVPALSRQMIEALGTRSQVTMPMLRAGEPIGAITLGWAEPDAFDDQQVALLQTFADQAVIAIENVRLFNETKEALERQTATAEILRVISSSPTDTQPVFDAIVWSAARLFHRNVSIVMREGDVLQRKAVARPLASPVDPDRIAKIFPIAFNPQGSQAARAISERRVIEIIDTEAPGESKLVTDLGRAAGYRSIAVVPLIRENMGIGIIGLSHPESGHRLSEKQIELVRTFADQAVIAIENVRLFNETKEALERQTATAEILKVISSSPTDLQPVFDAILEKATGLCDANLGALGRYDGERYEHLAHRGASPEFQAYLFGGPRVMGESTGIGRMISTRRPVHIPDIKDEPAYRNRDPARVATADLAGARTFLAVPMLKEGRVVGGIVIYRREVRPFGEKQIELVTTFASQAVIAIENVRLFNETREALERQTATAEILKVISDSPTDVQPVLDAVARRAAQLCESMDARIFFADGDVARYVSGFGEFAGVRDAVPMTRGSILARAIIDRTVVHVEDLAREKETEFPDSREMQAKYGHRTTLAVPLLREDKAIGGILLRRKEVRPFSAKQIELLKTFADQAVIAIENVRLFKELQARTEALTRSVGQLTALGEVGQAISSTLDLETVLKTIVSRAVQLTGLDGGSIFEYDERTEEFHLRATENVDEEYLAVLRSTPIRKGEGAVGRAGLTGEPVQISDVQDGSYKSRLRDALIRAGYRAVLVVPLRREEHVIGALSVTRKTPGPFAPEVVELLKTFATQSAMAIQNARLFREIAEKGKQLEVASRHKSDFLASMSHELRTPLNAILGFNEMILGQVYGEVPKDMQEPLADIQTSGKHLLRLINNVLDLAKIEAGRMELALSDYSVHDTVESVRSTLRPLAADKGLEFFASVSNDIPLAYGDGGRITQCLMNLAGNSLKFTKAGKVEISVEAKGELLVYKVADTGIGIPSDKIGSLFTEFKQTDATIASEYGGTGLGLSISKKFIEMHGGRIWVESESGKGSAFIFEVPLRVKAT